MPLRVDDPRDIQSSYNEELTPHALHVAETNLDGGHESISGYDRNDDGLDEREDEFDAAKTLDDAESGTSGAWNTNLGQSSSSQSLGDRIKKINFKRAAPMGGIIALLLSIAGLISFFGGPGLLVVNLAEVLTEKFNYQLGSIDMRQQKIVQAKLNNTTTGVCKVVNIRCKYSSFSDKEVANFKKAGIEVKTEGTSVLGRNKVTSLKLADGSEITAKNFASEMKRNPKLNSAMKKAYGLKYSTMSDKIFNGVAKKIGISKKAPFDEGIDDKQRKLVVEEDTKNGRGSINSAEGASCAKEQCTAEENAAKAKAASEASSGNQLVDESASSSNNLADQVINDNKSAIAKGSADVAAGVAAETVTSAIKITGVLDNACMVYGWVKTISYTAKVVRSVQMARYAMIFLTTASMIKAGTAKSEDVSYLGNILTKITLGADNKPSKSATDSFGYRYAAYGDSGLDVVASTAVAGANFGTNLQSTINAVLSVLGGKAAADKTCGFLSNTFVQVGSGIVGIASFIFGIGEAKIGIQAALAPLIMVAGAVLPAMIGDLVAGRLVDDSTYGERSGNLITSGTGGILSKVAGQGGNSILKRDQAQAYMQLQRETVLSYAQYDRETASPFDATNPHTFLGSLYTSIVPYFYSSQTATGAFGSLLSVVSSTASNALVPRSFAASQESYAECADPTYSDLGMATDPFCNPVFGIPPQYLGDDPNTINNRLLSKGLIDETTGDPVGGTYYDNFVKNCIDREDPFGSTPDESQVDETDQCFIDNQDKADLYVHFIDQRANDIGENGLPESSNASGTSSSSLAGAGTTGKDDVPAEWRNNIGRAWNGMIPGQCSAFVAWRFAQQWYGSLLNTDGSNLTALLKSHPIPHFGSALAVGNGGQVAGNLISAGVADPVANLTATQPGDIVSTRNSSSTGHVYVIVSNDNGVIKVEDYNAAGGPEKYGTGTVSATGYYNQSKVIAIARVHKNGGVK